MHWLDSIIKDHNAVLLTCEYPDRTIDGCVIRDNDENFVVIDSRLDIQHTRFTIAHEISHIIHDTIGGASKWDEQDADDLAIQILVTDTQIKDAIDDGYNDIPSFCSIFWVPYKYMEKRLEKFFNK